MFKKGNSSKVPDKIIDIEAGLRGDLKFTGLVNLRINGNFEGDLEAKGVLVIGEKAEVKSKTIKGDNITIAGRVKGDIVCGKRLELSPTARVIGSVETPVLIVNEGAILKGNCQMHIEEKKSEHKETAQEKKTEKKPAEEVKKEEA